VIVPCLYSIAEDIKRALANWRSGEEKMEITESSAAA
jgi:hypothetical protein